MATKKKTSINDARKEVIDALEKFISLEEDFNKNYPNKKLNCDIRNFSFYPAEVETSINEYEKIDVNFKMENGLSLRIELNKFNTLSLHDYLGMDISELENRYSSNEDNEDEEYQANDEDETIDDVEKD